MKKIEVFGLQSIPEIKYGDNLPGIIIKSCEEEIGGLNDRDIVVLTSKIVSKAGGLTKKLSDVQPGKKALKISRKTGKDAGWLQLIFDQGHQIVAIIPIKDIIEDNILNAAENISCAKELCEHEQAICITRDKSGMIHTCDAGIDGSNHPDGLVSFLPEDPDLEARKIRLQLQGYTGKKIAVILADTEIIPFGTMDFAIGTSGISPRSKAFGRLDKYGKPKFGGMDLVANELTAASALVFGQTNESIPAAVIRNYQFEINEEENFKSTFLNNTGDKDIARSAKTIMKATACAMDFKWRCLLKMASWFI